MTASRAAAIGTGLATARIARPLQVGERIHVVGAAGAGASAAALLARYAGGAPSGCDPGGPSPYSVALEEAHVPLAWEHDARHVTASPRPDRLAVTKALTAVAPDHPELHAALELGIPVESWQQVVADIATGRVLVGVAGTHGKSTIAGWLVDVLVRCDLDPWAFVGALMPAELTGGAPATARCGGGPAAPFIVEADEYAGNFDPYRPSLAVLSNVDWDHPDVFANRAAAAAAFGTWIRAAGERSPDPPHLVVNVGDDGAADVAASLVDWAGTMTVVRLLDGVSDPARSAVHEIGSLRERFTTPAGPAGVLVGWVRSVRPEEQALEIIVSDVPGEPRPARITLAGRHNAVNALVVAAAAARLAPGRNVIAALAAFRGVGRRLERRGEVRGVVVYDDYGHHPTAIRATLEALRQREPGRRTWAVYEPLTYHRTAAFLEEFAAALSEADAVVVADIWPGRDTDTSIATAEALAEAVARRRPSIPVAAPGTVEETATWLGSAVRAGDAVLVMGGGRSYRIAELLLEHLAG